MKVISSFFCCLIAMCFANEEMTVHIGAHQKNGRCNVYFAKLRPLETNAAKEIEMTLRKDLDFSHEVHLQEIDEQKQFLAYQTLQKNNFDATTWAKWETDFVVIPQLLDEKLSLRIYDVATGKPHELTMKNLPSSLVHLKEALHHLTAELYERVLQKNTIVHKKILFSKGPLTCNEANWKSEIWQMDYDGSAQQQITFENSYSITPSFISSSKNSANYHFIYVCYKQGQPRVYIASKESGRGAELLTLQGNQLLPEMSRDRKMIAFVSDALGRADLFIQEVNPSSGPGGKPKQIYSYPKSVQASPTFSPDGEQIAFVTDQFGTPKIGILRVGEAMQSKKRLNPNIITKKTHDNTSPHWSPDGKKIVYSAKESGVRQIFVYDVLNNSHTQLTFDLGNKENPKWASDSFHIVYNTTSPSYDIYMLDLESKNPIKLTNGQAKYHYPCMEP